MADIRDKLHISRIWARNYKSLRQFELELAPFTVLVGRNGSGKSNILDVLRFISEAFYDGVQNAITYRNGPSSILHVSEGKPAREFTVGLRATSRSLVAEYQLTVRLERRERVSVPEERINLRLGDKERRIIVRNGVFAEPRLKPPIRGVLKELSKRQRADAAVTPMLSLIGDQPSFAATISGWLFPSREPEDVVDIASAISDLSGLLGEMRFYRIFPDAIREPQPVSLRDSLEEDGTNFASVLRSLKEDYPHSYERALLALQRVVPSVVDIDHKTVGRTQIVRLVHSDAKASTRRWPLDIAQESDGTARVLALLIAIEQQPAPALLAIEEPELGIHTGALSVIVDLLDGASSSSQVLVSTHSCDLLDFVPADAIRVVVSVNGESSAGPIADHQKDAIREQLMTAGYVHRVEGLELKGIPLEK